jgi:hypothetical protein
MHSEPVQDKTKLNQAFWRWIAWVQAILPQDKWNRFNSLITVPLPTNRQAQSIFTELKKVFQSMNSIKKLQFIDPALLNDFQEYDQKVKISSYMQTKGWEAVKTQLNSFVVIDLPQKQITPRPEPYPVLISISSVFDCAFDEDEELEYLFYKITDTEGKPQMCVMDDEFYRIYKMPEQGATWEKVLESQHSIFDAQGVVVDGPGYVPANGVWKTASKSSNFIDKIGPVTNVLGDLDWYLFKDISFKYLGLYGDYPIIFTYKQVCDYKNDQGAMCEGGKVERIMQTGVDAATSVWEDCPACSARKGIGPGSRVTIDAPKDGEDVDLMKNPIYIAEISNDKLEYGKTYLDDLEDDTFLTCVGQDLEPTAMAQNEKQVQKSVESKQNVLQRIATNIDLTDKFIYDTCNYLRYGRRNYLGSTISSGDEFYLHGAEDLNGRYADAKNAGKPMYELAEIRDLANKIENRNNPEALQRNEVLNQLEPWPDLSIAQITTLGLHNIDAVNFAIKINFNSFIDRFERENINIVEFGSKTDQASKINAINLKLQQYAKATISSSQPDPRADAPAPTRPA